MTESELAQLMAIRNIVDSMIAGTALEAEAPAEQIESDGCQCTGDPLPNVQNVGGAGPGGGDRYACTGCGKDVSNVSKRKVVS